MGRREAGLPNWDRVCEEIVDGDGDKVRKCKRILREETAGLGDCSKAAPPRPGLDGWFDRMMQGEGGAWLMLGLPVAALFGYIWLQNRKAVAQDDAGITAALERRKRQLQQAQAAHSP